MTGYRILVASYTDSITSLLFDPNGPTLIATSEITVGTHPSWLTAHPTDPSLVFTGLEQPEGIAVALKYDNSGIGNIVGQIPSGGADPASLLATANALLIGNYSSGTILAAPLSPTSPNCFVSSDPDVARTELQLRGTGPNTARQESSHPHQIVAVPGRDELLVVDLGADRTWRVVHDPRRGTLSVQGTVEYAPGSGPRHVVFHDGILYTLNELTSTLTAHALPPLPAAATLLSTTSSLQLPPGEALGDRLAAELLLAPALTEDAQNGNSPPPFLYATNRNDPRAAGDTLAIFSLEDPTAPSLVAEVHTGLRHLRGAAIGGEDGRWIVLGGGRGGGVKVYERVDGGRSVKEVAARSDIQAPTGFLWVSGGRTT